MLNVFAFRLVLIVSIVLTIVGVAVDVLTMPLLPTLLQLYDEGWTVVDMRAGDAYGQNEAPLYLQLEMTEPSAGLMVLGCSALLVLIAALVAMYVGLFRLRAWGAWLMLGLTVLLSLLTPLFGVMVTSPWAAPFYDVGALLHGGLLALIYLGPLRPTFFGDGPVLPWLKPTSPA